MYTLYSNNIYYVLQCIKALQGISDFYYNFKNRLFFCLLSFFFNSSKIHCSLYKFVLIIFEFTILFPVDARKQTDFSESINF